jgi:hypothetical protein
MAEPTATLATLRQSLSREMRMPFFRRWTSLTADTTSTVAKLVDATLTQESGYWENQWVYVPSTGDVRQIVSWDKTSYTLQPEYDFTSMADTDITDGYEIHLAFNAIDLKGAINRAIDESFPAFFDVAVDETMCLQEDTREYTLAGLAVVPWLMRKVWVEVIDNGASGTATAGGATSITLESGYNCADMQTNPTRYRISIYDGTSKGDVRTPSAYNNTTKIATVTAWTATPTTTSKYRVWDASSQSSDWRRLLSVKLDQKEWPTKMYLTSRFSGFNGGRFRIQYLAQPAALTTEASTTIVPKEYIIEKAQSYLYGTMANSNRFNRERYAQLETRHGQLAETYRNMKAFDRPDGSLWTETDPYGDGDGGSLTDPGNPLGW